MEVNIDLNQKKRRKVAVIIIIMLIAIISIMAWVGIKLTKIYNAPDLIGAWISSETGKEVEFMEDGSVMVDKIKTGTYTVKHPNTIIYDIEGHTFDMVYKLEGRGLLWGIGEEEEAFQRKGL